MNSRQITLKMEQIASHSPCTTVYLKYTKMVCQQPRRLLSVWSPSSPGVKSDSLRPLRSWSLEEQEDGRGGHFVSPFVLNGRKLRHSAP